MLRAILPILALTLASPAMAELASPRATARIHLGGVELPLAVDEQAVLVQLSPIPYRTTTHALAALREDRVLGDAISGAELLPFGDGWVKLETKGNRQALVEALRQRPLVRTVAPAHVTADRFQTPILITDRVLVAFHPGADSAQRDSLLQSRGALEVRELRKDTYRVHASPEHVFLLAESLRRDPSVRWAHPDFFTPKEAHGAASDQFYPDQWTLRNTGQTGLAPGLDINIEPAWALTKGRPELRIAVYDNGVEPDHPEFRREGKIVAPWRVTTAEPDGSPRQFVDRHGMAVAGIAVADSDDSLGISGVAPGCAIMPVYGVYDSTEEQLAEGFYYMVENGASVIVNSWGYGNPSIMSDVLADALEHCRTAGRSGLGTVLTFSAGNNNWGTSTRLTGHPAAIAVGSIADSGVKADYSNAGVQVDLVTPSAGGQNGYWPRDGGTGSGVFTTDRQGIPGYNIGSPGLLYWMLNQNNSAQGEYYITLSNGFASEGIFHRWRLRMETTAGDVYDETFEIGHVFAPGVTGSTLTVRAQVPLTGPLKSYQFDIEIDQSEAFLMIMLIGRIGGPQTAAYNGDEGFDPIRQPLTYRGFVPEDNGPHDTGDRFGNFTNEFAGTSASSPMAAGVAALMLSVNPALTSAEVEEILKSTARPVDPEGGYYNARGHSPYYGYGLLDAGAAVQEAKDRYDQSAVRDVDGWLLR